MPIVKYAYNDTQHSSIGLTPFYADYGCTVSPILQQVKSETNVNSADKLVNKLMCLKAKIVTNLAQATQ